LESPATNQSTPPRRAPESTRESPVSLEPERTHVEVDDSAAIAGYANFCRVTGTPEELIIDFGLNPQPFGVPTHPIAVTQRIITNLYTAKRLVQVLQLTVERHEAAFGALEIDVRRRAAGR
jgi:hypothetical protein